MNRCPFCEKSLDDYELLHDGANIQDGESFEYECPHCQKNLEIMVWITYDFDIEKGTCAAHDPTHDVTTPTDVACGNRRFVCDECDEEFVEPSHNGVLKF